MKVRLVDDNADMIALFRTNMELHRPDVDLEVVHDGFDRLLDTNQWADVDIAVLDVMLPGTVSGAHIALYLAQHVPHIRRVFWTASGIARSRDLAYLADRVIEKGELSMDDLDKAVFGDS